MKSGTIFSIIMCAIWTTMYAFKGNVDASIGWGFGLLCVIDRGLSELIARSENKQVTGSQLNKQ